MSDDQILSLASSRIGRILIHLIALNEDFKFNWHWKGIKRDLIGV